MRMQAQAGIRIRGFVRTIEMSIRNIVVMMIFLLIAGYVGSLVSGYIPDTGNAFLDNILSLVFPAVILIYLARYLKGRGS